ncbi:transcription factor E2F8 isoform X2 [Microcaecilia unicolor]|uniref:Transcription factor E2F8 n=1 Tax=Microcaecilia unicolor TaxID=1415580 RepID=A0A6P7XMJ8_9AMPH|nr:transcription factor E2F8 isoform X2 [Microcaecilia unicolor]
METYDKENIFSEPHKRILHTPLKQSSTSCSVLGEIQLDTGPLTTPTKPIEMPGEPWTPTANLKMLISAASPEIRNREQQLELFGNGSDVLEAKDNLHEHLSGDECEKTQPSRKEKSLGLLCHKFLARYPNYPNPAVNNEICLDEVAEELNVERRRIYDIVNVLESLHMVSRLAKNRYTWHGRHNLSQTFGTLKRAGEENRYAEQINEIKKREKEQELDSDREKSQEITSDPSVIEGHMCFVELPGMEFRAASVNSRKDKSLRVMSQKFVMLFLVSKPQIVSLEVAAKILIGEDNIEDLDKSKFKTKIRRLYDIANVLSSLELIKKVHVTEEKGRKPAFKWMGPDDFPDDANTLPASLPLRATELKTPKEQCAKNLFPSSGKQSFTRHPSLVKLAKRIESDRRKINSAPTSPIKTSEKSDTGLQFFPNKMAQLAAICKLQLEEHSQQLKRKTNSQLSKSTLPCKTASLESLVQSDSSSPPSSQSSPIFQPEGLIPVTHSELTQAVPVVLPYTHSGTPYMLYIQPSQVRTVTMQNPSPEAHSVPCVDGAMIQSSLKANCEVVCGAEGGRLAKTQSVLKSKSLAPMVKNESIPEKCLKRLQSPEDTGLAKISKGDSAKVDDVLGPLFPSGYLIPLSHLASLGSESSLPGQERADTSPENKLSNSPSTGVIPIPASDLSAIAVPSLHMAPLNLLVPQGSLAALPVLSGASTAFASNHAAPHTPNPAIFNFTLQHLGLLSPQMQVSACPGPVTISPRIEHGNPISEDLSVSKHVSPEPGHNQLTGQPITMIALQQAAIPVTPKGLRPAHENFFRTPGGLSTMSGLSSPSADSAAAHKISLGTFIPQRKLEVTTEVIL